MAAFAAHAALLNKKEADAEEARRKAELAQQRREREEAFAARDERRMNFVDLVASALTERGKLQLVLAHIGTAQNAELAPAGMVDFLLRRLAQIEALIDGEALSLSARYSKVDFEEVRTDQRETRWTYYAKVGLHLWSVDAEAGSANSVSPLEWAVGRNLVQSVNP